MTMKQFACWKSVINFRLFLYFTCSLILQFLRSLTSSHKRCILSSSVVLFCSFFFSINKVNRRKFGPLSNLCSFFLIPNIFPTQHTFRMWFYTLFWPQQLLSDLSPAWLSWWLQPRILRGLSPLFTAVCVRR